MILRRIRGVFASGGLWGVLRAAGRRIARPRARSFTHVLAVISEREGIEIGGPSSLFARGGLLPVYPHVRRLDNVNFSSHTIWEGTLAHGTPFAYDARREPGRQFIGEAGDLTGIPDASYDFVLSAHMLEHTANPLRALAEWRRVLRSGGALVLVVPHRDGTFDHRRPVTTLAHLRDDLASDTREDDVTHLAEILALHDLARDPGAGDVATFRERAQRNAEFRSLHQHVFDARLAMAVVSEAGFTVTALETLRPYHIIVVGRAPGQAATVEGLTPEAIGAVLARSPFALDRA